MSGVFTISLSGPVKSAEIIPGYVEGTDFDSQNNGSMAEPTSVSRAEETAAMTKAELKKLFSQKETFKQACLTLNNVVDKLNQFCVKLFTEHKTEIAKLSVEIARKVLVQKIENGDYKIESIIQEALGNVPDRQDVVVHLNPEDMECCRKAQQDEPDGIFAGIRFVSDPKIGRAECLLESPKGIIESRINEHLEEITKALYKAQ